MEWDDINIHIGIDTDIGINIDMLLINIDIEIDINIAYCLLQVQTKTAAILHVVAFCVYVVASEICETNTGIFYLVRPNHLKLKSFSI